MSLGLRIAFKVKVFNVAVPDNIAAKYFLNMNMYDTRMAGLHTV